MSNTILFLTTNDIEVPTRGCDRRSSQLYHWISAWSDTVAISYKKSGEEDQPTSSSNQIRLSYPAELLAPIHPVVFYRLIRWRLSPDRHFDIVVASGMGSLIFALVARVMFRSKLVVDCHNVESQLSRDIGTPVHRIFSLTIERVALRLADRVLVTSERDRRQFSESIQNKSIIVANGYDQSVFYANSDDREDRILFFGNMNYRPNQQAVKVIADRIAPSLTESGLDIRIHIAGPHCDQIQESVRHLDNVRVVGLVDDIAKHIRRSAVVIVPLLTGSGTRLKIIESLACGTPVISTPKGAEGWPQSWNSLIVTDLDSFPEIIVDTLRRGVEPTDAELAEFQDYRWEAQVGRIRPFLEDTQ